MFIESQCKKRDILIFKRLFQCGLDLNEGKYHTCLFHCINTCRVPRTMFEHGLVFKKLPRDGQMSLHEKTCLFPIRKCHKHRPNAKVLVAKTDVSLDWYQISK